MLIDVDDLVLGAEYIVVYKYPMMEDDESYGTRVFRSKLRAYRLDPDGKLGELEFKYADLFLDSVEIVEMRQC